MCKHCDDRFVTMQLEEWEKERIHLVLSGRGLGALDHPKIQSTNRYLQAVEVF